MFKKSKRLLGLCLGVVLSLGVGVGLGTTHGEAVGVKGAAQTVTVKISERATTLSWTNATAYSGWTDASGIFTFKQTGNGNNGKYYSSDTTWRFYSGGTVGISCPDTYEIESVSDNLNKIWTITTDKHSASLSVSASSKFTKFTISYTAASTTPLEEIELRGYPTSDMEIGDTATLSYYGMDTDANEWKGNVVYVSSNENVATVDEDGVLTALAGGTTNLSVYANAGVDGAKVESEPVTLTVLADPERIDLPTGTYVVNIDYSSVKKNDSVPSSKTYEIKEKEGTGADRVWYKNMSIAYNNVKASYATEYTFLSDTSTATITNNSNAKVTSVTIKYYDTKRLTFTDAEGTTITGTADSNVVTYNLNSSSFTLKGQTSVANTSLYYINITFSVVDESEQFLSLVVSKSASWSKTSYKEKESPSTDGLVATANYTSDGTTISRSVDVTSQVTSWTFTPSVLTTSDTSFSVVATWNGNASNSFTVEGITVAPISGAIESGRYFIYTDTAALEVKEYTSQNSRTSTKISKTSAWDFELVADDTYNIYTTIDGVKNYLYVSNDNSGLRTSETTANWTLTALTGDDAGKYSLVSNDGTNDRYLCNYDPTSTNDWRTYKSGSIGTMYKLSITEEKEIFATNFLNTFTAGCNPNGGYDTDNMDWASAKTQFNTLSSENKSVFVNTTVDESSTDNVVKCVNRYDYIVNKYGTSVFEDFMNRGNFPTSSSNAIYRSTDNNTAILIVVLVSFTSITAIGGYFFIRKRRYN